jgi:hypothetical protein
MTTTRRVLSVVVFLCAIAPLRAGEPVTLENVVAPDPNVADGPLIEKYSPEQALHFLDSASLYWQKKWKCLHLP